MRLKQEDIDDDDPSPTSFPSSWPPPACISVSSPLSRNSRPSSRRGAARNPSRKGPEVHGQEIATKICIVPHVFGNYSAMQMFVVGRS